MILEKRMETTIQTSTSSSRKGPLVGEGKDSTATAALLGHHAHSERWSQRQIFL